MIHGIPQTIEFQETLATSQTFYIWFKRFDLKARDNRQWNNLFPVAVC